MADMIDQVCASIQAWGLEQPNPEALCEDISATAATFVNKYVDEGNEEALQAAVYLSAVAVACSNSHYRERSHTVSIFHQAFWHKYLLRRDPRDLHCVLRALFEDVKLYPVGDKKLVGPYASISDVYLERFNRWRRDDDLLKAVMYGQKAVKLFHPDLSMGAYQLYRRALAFAKAYESDGAERSLHSGIIQMGGAICASFRSGGWIELGYMNAYANLLSIRAGRSYGSHLDIEAAVYWARRAYEGADESDPFKAAYAQNLSNRYYQRYKRKTKSLWDLDKAIEILTTLPNAELELGGRASSLALELLDRYRDFADTAALIEAVRIGRVAVQNNFSEGGINRAKVEHIAALCLEAFYEHSHETDVLEEALRHAGRAVTFSHALEGANSDFSDTLSKLTQLKEEADLSRPQNLCKRCSCLPHELFETGSEMTCQLFTGQHVLDQLQRSIEGGCHLCALIKDVIDSSPVSEEPSAVEHTEILLRAGEKPSFWTELWTEPWTCWLTVRLGAQDAGKLRIFNDYGAAKSTPGMPLSNFPVAVETEILTPSQFALMNAWLDECMSKHADCSSLLVHSAIFELPSRLIDISLEGSIYNARLVETQGWPADGHSYAALSHCWGPNPSEIPQTLKDNLESRKQAIDFNALSKTFQEAIKVTQALQIRYLWIDSLCIVQNDATDWAQEASNMHRIYESAIVTLVASASPDGKAGLCTPRDASHRARMNTCQLDVHSPKGATRVIVYPHLLDWENAVETGPLNKRGWCFQERQLSRRMIHFTEMRILWECKSNISSEDQKAMRDRPINTQRVMSGTGRLWDTRGGHDVMKATLGLDFASKLASRQVWIPTKWCQVVEEYSRRQLSYEKDKLPALAGLAHTISDFLHGSDVYLVGLWKQYLARDLSWFPAESERSRGTRDPAAPSWSWAAWPGPVEYYASERFEAKPDEDGRRELRPVKSWEDLSLEIVYTEMTLEGIDAFGRVNKGAKLVVSSVVADITISEVYYLPQFHPRRPNLKCYSMFKGPGLSGISITEQWTARYDFREAIRHGYVCFDENPERLDLKEFICLRLGKGVSRMNHVANGAEKVDTGLLLGKIDGMEEYRRVGIFEVGPLDEEWVEKGQWRTLTIV